MDLVGIKNIYISAHVRLDEVGHIRLYVDGVLKVVVAFGRNLQLNQLIRLQIEKDEALFVCLAFVSAAHRLLIEPGVPSGIGMERSQGLNYYLTMRKAIDI